jgi:probable F420-dependent oxidoreductase
MHPLRFGVIGESIRNAAQLIATARRAEELGYSTLLLRDHFVREPFGDQLAPLLALTTAAAATRTLRVGSLVLDNDYRHPVMLAKEAATLDVLSGGRFELGLGAGWLRDEYERAGMPFDRAGARVDRLEESLRVLKGLLSGRSVTISGEHYAVRGLTGFPEPVQRPHPPLLLGAGSPRMLAMAGREADIVGILPRALPEGAISDELSERSPEALERKVGIVREAADGRDVELSIVADVRITADHVAAARRIATERGWGPEAAEAVLRMPGQLLGTPERIRDELHARRDRHGVSYFVVSDTVMEEAALVLGPGRR